MFQKVQRTSNVSKLFTLRLKEPLWFQKVKKYTTYMSKFLTVRRNEPHSQQGLIAYPCITTNESWYSIFCTNAEDNLAMIPSIAITFAGIVKMKNCANLYITTYFFLWFFFFCAFAFGFFRSPPLLDFFSEFSEPFSAVCPSEVEALDASAFLPSSCSFASRRP